MAIPQVSAAGTLYSTIDSPGETAAGSLPLPKHAMQLALQAFQSQSSRLPKLREVVDSKEPDLYTKVIVPLGVDIDGFAGSIGELLKAIDAKKAKMLDGKLLNKKWDLWLAAFKTVHVWYELYRDLLEKFPQVNSRQRDLPLANCKSHLDALENCLISLADWLKPLLKDDEAAACWNEKEGRAPAIPENSGYNPGLTQALRLEFVRQRLPEAPLESAFEKQLIEGNYTVWIREQIEKLVQNPGEYLIRSSTRQQDVWVLVFRTEDNILKHCRFVPTENGIVWFEVHPNLDAFVQEAFNVRAALAEIFKKKPTDPKDAPPCLIPRYMTPVVYNKSLRDRIFVGGRTHYSFM